MMLVVREDLRETRVDNSPSDSILFESIGDELVAAVSGLFGRLVETFGATAADIIAGSTDNTGVKETRERAQEGTVTRATWDRVAMRTRTNKKKERKKVKIIKIII